MREIWSRKIIVPALMLTTLYVVTAVYLMNVGLVKDTLFGTYSFDYKTEVLGALLIGMWTAMSGLSLFLLITVAWLSGLNLVLAVERFRKIRSSGKMHLAMGGSSLLGIVGSGCASCGLPILALLGLGGAAASLPFRGVELSLIALVLLLISLYVLVKGEGSRAVCAVEPLKYQEQRIIIPK